MTLLPASPDRRTLLRLLAASAALTAGGAVAPPWARRAAAQAGLIAPNVCALTPEVTEGPYYIDPKLLRADIREDRPGIPLKLAMQIVDASCRPLPGARVDIWHCDASGDYSGYAKQGSDGVTDTSGQTFLRGTLIADARGVADFVTIYPGWYRGRTTHIHFKVFVEERTVLTGQLFFPDALSEYVYLNDPRYRRDATRDTINARDGIARQAGEGSYAAVREQEDGYEAELVVGIDPNAVSRDVGMPGGPRGPGGGPGGRPPGPPPEGFRGGPGGRPPGPPPEGFPGGFPGGPGGPGGSRTPISPADLIPGAKG
ncbi:intradiol ring-cleavage dioxygenase [Neomegalonema sp.]|uniref:intradiol ring-cleavage dioxygenase n=1 Tax=Neomegalonema sp. TaxID=2039713 RepID=UPI002615C537|nr:intradiol ring-cleavage dioxygenase [Neomegalonema sp.]MDD2867615.1 intradiol ring-cleavage dioxygenase [Neomegalonema sp.]